ncbi:unnamed protein product, partial [Rotaria magnacalcarata]
IDACRREIGQLTTKINELAQLYMANHPAKTLDYCTVQQLSLSIIEKLDRSRDEKSFEPFIIGQRDDNQNEEFYRTSIYYQLIDNILIELKDRFSLKNLQFLCGISTLSPDSDSFLHFESIKTFASHLNLNLDFLFNKLTVAKPMLKYKSLSNIIDLYQELLPFQEAFPVLVALIQSTITIPESSKTRERTFPKGK